MIPRSMFFLETFFALLLLVILFGLCVDRLIRSRAPKREASEHFDGRRFLNLGKVARRERPMTVWKWILSRPKSDWKERMNRASFVALPQRVEGAELRVTFVNHATVLIQTQGLNIVTDPVWAQRLSLFTHVRVGPKRFREPGISFEQLPPIDIVLISHNHYDHMDVETLKRLQERWHPKIYTGLGNSDYLRRHGIKSSHDMDWWDEVPLASSVKLVCVPAQHFSSRAISDRDVTLWCGFVLETKDGNMYFAGDTGYGDFVHRLKARWSSFRLALLPIGAFKPEWFMGPVHISPDQALQIHQELQVKTSVAIHFGTFRLADDKQDEPAERIKELLAQAKEPKPNFRILENGESAMIS